MGFDGMRSLLEQLQADAVRVKATPASARARGYDGAHLNRRFKKSDEYVGFECVTDGDGRAGRHHLHEEFGNHNN